MTQERDERMVMESAQLAVLSEIAASVRRAIRWLTISQYVLMLALLVHGWIVKAVVK